MTKSEFNKVIDEAIPTHIKELLQRNNDIFLCGGSLRSLYLGELPNDYDLFFTNEDGYKKALEHYRFYQKSDNGYVTTIPELKTQLIYKKFFETPEHIIDSFDYCNICAAYNYNTGLFLNDEFMSSNDNKEVRVNVITNTLSSLKRLGRYIIGGYEVKGAYDYIVSVMQDKGIVCVMSEYYEG